MAFEKSKNRKKMNNNAPRKPRKKRWVEDRDGQLSIAKSIASRFGIELVEEEFFEPPEIPKN